MERPDLVALQSVLESPSIVVAEDDLATRALLRATLERADYRVREFDDGADALREILRQPPDVALLDIGMPGMDGYEVARRIRSNPANRRLSLIALTGWGQDEDRKRSVAAGFNHHLVKPADIEQLRQLLTVA